MDMMLARALALMAVLVTAPLTVTTATETARKAETQTSVEANDLLQALEKHESFEVCGGLVNDVEPNRVSRCGGTNKGLPSEQASAHVERHIGVLPSVFLKLW
jgi:hypothetical protein